MRNDRGGQPQGEDGAPPRLEHRVCTDDEDDVDNNNDNNETLLLQKSLAVSRRGSPGHNDENGSSWDWGVVSSSLRDGGHNNSNDLSPTGVLILPADDDDDGDGSKSLRSSSNNNSSQQGRQYNSSSSALNLSLPGTESLPTDLGSMQDPLSASSSQNHNHHHRVRTFSDVEAEEKKRQQRTHFLIAVAAVVLVGVVFLVLAVSLSATSYLLYERSLWQESTARLEEQISQFQLELAKRGQIEESRGRQITVELEKTRLELEKKKQEYETSLKDLQKKKKDLDRKKTSFESKQKRASLTFDDAKTMGNKLVDNCWVKADVRLGQCADQAQVKVKEGLNKWGRALWKAKDRVRNEIGDFGKKVHGAAKNAAAKMAQQDDKESSWDQQSVSRMATTLLSGVAFASLAAFLSATQRSSSESDET